MWKQSALRSVLLGSTWRCCWMQTPSTACWVTQSLWTSSRAKISSWKGSSCWSCQASSLQQRGNGWSSKECIFSLHDWEELKKKKKNPSFSLFSFRHFHGFRLSNLSRTMKANIKSLLLSDVKGGSASGWRQDGLFNFCYSLLFR